MPARPNPSAVCRLRAPRTGSFKLARVHGRFLSCGRLPEPRLSLQSYTRMTEPVPSRPQLQGGKQAMCRTRPALFLIAVLSAGYLTAAPSRSYAQYNCPVAIELKGKAVLQASIRDVERPPTEVLWEEKLQTLNFTPARDGKKSARSSQQ